MIWSHHGPIVCYFDFSEWGGGWDDTVYIVDYGYVVLPKCRKIMLHEAKGNE